MITKLSTKYAQHMKIPNMWVLLTLALAGCFQSVAVAQVLGTNLIVNGNAESGPGSTDGDTPPVPNAPGWTLTGTFLVPKYDVGPGSPASTDPGSPTRAANFFAGGPSAANSSAAQSINVSAAAAAIDANSVTYNLSGWFGGYANQDDNARLTITFKNAGAAAIGTASIGAVTAADRSNITSMLFRNATGNVPVGTRTIDVVLLMTYASGVYNDGDADDLSLILSAPATGISTLLHKDLIFPQVAAGGQYETWITVTNRGTQAWTGNFFFYTGQRAAWNPYVNGAQIAGGTLAVQIPSKGTATYKVTVPGNTQAGYLVIMATTTSLDNFLEGNLTYYVSSGGVVVDSVGIVPSNPVMATAIPFEDFTTLAFAFANTDTQGRSANMTLTLYSDTNSQVGTPVNRPLANGEYFAQYLWQIVPTAPNTHWRGRLEIRSDVPVSGVALTQIASGQLSSLPLQSTTLTYSVSVSSSYVPFARMTLWADGIIVGGYGTASSYPDLWGLYGQIASDGSLHVHFDGKSAATSNYEIYGIMKTDGVYTPGMSSITGTYYVTAPSRNHMETGTFTATLIP
jgi:hypothetical protein